MMVIGVAEAPAAWHRFTRPMDGDLLDLNVWLALVVAEHPHHTAARRYWDETQAEPASNGQRRWFCRSTMLGLVRLLSQPKVMGDAVLGLSDAHAIYRQLRQAAGVGLMPDCEAADAPLAERLTRMPGLPARLWTNIWLVATADAAGLRLVTFDADFERLAPQRLLRLQP